MRSQDSVRDQWVEANLGVGSAAGERSFFAYKDGHIHGECVWREDWPIFQKKIGAPLGTAKRVGHAYTREFTNVSVELDIKNKTSRLLWKPPS